MKNFFIFFVRFSLASRYASRMEMNGKVAWNMHAGGFVIVPNEDFPAPIRVSKVP